MHLGDALIIAGDEAEEDFGEEPALLQAEPAHDAEVDGDEPALLVDEQIALMHVGVEEAVAHGVAQEGLQHLAADRLEIIALGRDALDVRQRNAVDPFERQHLASRAVPVDAGHANLRIVGDIVANSEAAAASRRKSVSSLTVRASVSTTSIMRSRRASEE